MRKVTQDVSFSVTLPADVSNCIIRFHAISFSRDSMFSNIVPSSRWDFGSEFSNFSLFFTIFLSFSVETSPLTMCTDLDVSPGDRQDGA